MTKLKQLAASITLLAAFGTAGVGVAVAQDGRNTTVQDGIDPDKTGIGLVVPLWQLAEGSTEV